MYGGEEDRMKKKKKAEGSEECGWTGILLWAAHHCPARFWEAGVSVSQDTQVLRLSQEYRHNILHLT